MSNKKAINTQSVLISSTGITHKEKYAIKFLEKILKNKWGRLEFYKGIQTPDAQNNYAEWLCNNTGFCLLHNNKQVINSTPPTLKQQKIIKILESKNEYMSRR